MVKRIFLSSVIWKEIHFHLGWFSFKGGGFITSVFGTLKSKASITILSDHLLQSAMPLGEDTWTLYWIMMSIIYWTKMLDPHI